MMDEIVRDSLGPADETALEPQTPSYPVPGQQHLQHLWNNVHTDPTLADDFDAKFGPGAAAREIAKENAKALPWPKQNRVAFDAAPRTYSSADLGTAMVNQSDLTEQMDQYVERESYRLDAERERASLSSIRSFAMTAKGYDAAKTWIDLELDQAQKSVDRWKGELTGRVDAPEGSDLLRDEGGAPIVYGDPTLDNLASYLHQAQERLKIAQQIKADLASDTPRSAPPPDRIKITVQMAELERDIATDEEILATSDMGPAKAATFEYSLQMKRKRYAQLETQSRQARQAPAIADDDPRATWLQDAARATVRGFAGMLEASGSAAHFWSKDMGSMQVAGVLFGELAQEFAREVKEGTPAEPVDALDVLTSNPTSPGYLRKWQRLTADAMGAALGSSAPVLAAAIAAHAGGSAVGGPAVGGVAGKATAVAMNIAVGQGEFRNQLIQAFKDEGLPVPDDEQVSGLIIGYGSLIGAIETISDIWILGGLGSPPTEAAKQAINRSAVKMLAKAVAKGALTESMEEFAQEWTATIGVQHAKGEGLTQQEFHKKLADSIRAAAMGGIGGAGLGAGKGAIDIVRGRQQTQTLPPGMPEAKAPTEQTSPTVESGLEAGLAEAATQDPAAQAPEEAPQKLNNQDIADFVGIWEYVREQDKKQPDDPSVDRKELERLKGELADLGLAEIETAADVRKALETRTLDATIADSPPSIDRYGEPLEGLSERERLSLAELADELQIADNTDASGVSLADQVESQAAVRFQDDPAGAEDALTDAGIRRMAEMRREGISFSPEIDVLLDKLVEKEATSAVERLEREQAAMQVQSLNRMLGLGNLSPEAAAAARSEVIDEARATGKPLLDVAQARSDALLKQAQSNGLKAYLEAGNSLDTADLPIMAARLGVSRQSLPALLERAKEEGLLRQDRRGRWLRGPKAPDIRTDLAQALDRRPGYDDLTSVFDEAVATAKRWAPPQTRFRSFAGAETLPDGLREQVMAAEQARGERATGFAYAGDVFISAYALNPAAKMGHEVVHALVDNGQMTEAEVAILAQRAEKTGIFTAEDKAGYELVYGRDQSKQREEAAAAAIEARIGGADLGRQANTVADRIIQFFERVRNALIGRGFQSFEDVVDAFLSGKMAARGGRLSADPAVVPMNTGDGEFGTDRAFQAGLFEGPAGAKRMQQVVDTWLYVRDVRQMPEPVRLVEFLRDRGGLREDAGEIRNMLGAYNMRPGLVSKNGVHLDEATRAALDAGYLVSEERPEINDLLAALDEDLSGRPVTSQRDADIVEAKGLAAELIRDLENLGIADARSEQQVRSRLANRRDAQKSEDDETPVLDAATLEARVQELIKSSPDLPAALADLDWDPINDGPLFSFGDDLQKAVDALRTRPLDGDIIPPARLAEADTWFGQYALRVLGDKLDVDETTGLLRVRQSSEGGTRSALSERLAALGLPPIGQSSRGISVAASTQPRSVVAQDFGRPFNAIERVTGLKLDAASIEQRARAQLFTVEGWHGTTHDFSRGPLSAQIPTANTASDFGFHFAVGRPSAANFRLDAPVGIAETLIYKLKSGVVTLPPTPDGANVLPLMVRANKPLRVDDAMNWRSPLNWFDASARRKGDIYKRITSLSKNWANRTGVKNSDFRSVLFSMLEEEGYDSIVYENKVEDPGRDSMFVWNPGRQVRSKFDLFDPRAVGDVGLVPSLKYLADDVMFSFGRGNAMFSLRKHYASIPKKISEVQVLHEPLRLEDRPAGVPRAGWREDVERPWRVGVQRFATRAEAEARAAEMNAAANDVYVRAVMSGRDAGARAIEVFEQFLSDRGVAFVRSDAKTTESKYLRVKLPDGGSLTLRFSDHSQYAALGGRSRASSSDQWEFPTGLGGNGAARVASGLRSFDENFLQRQQPMFSFERDKPVGDLRPSDDRPPNDIIDKLTPLNDDIKYSFGQKKLPKPGLEQPTRSLDELVSDLAAALNVTVRVGKLDSSVKRASRKIGREAQGQINVNTGVLRINNHANLETLADLGGKALLNRYGQDMHVLLRRYVSETSRYLPRDPQTGLVLDMPANAASFAIGEFFRHYITNAAYAEDTSPQFYQAFEAFLDQREPRMLAYLQDIQENVEDWKAAPSVGVVSSNIQSSYQPGTLERILKHLGATFKNATQAAASGGRDAVSESLRDDVRDPMEKLAGKAYVAALDRLGSVEDMRDAILEQINRDIADGRIPVRDMNSREMVRINQAEHDPGKLARLAQNAYQAGHLDINNGVRPYKGLRHSGPSLRDGIVTAMGGEKNWTDEKFKLFDTYLWSKNMIERWQDHADGKLDRFPDKMSAANHRQTIAELRARYPDFEPGSQMIYQYLANIRDKWFASGLLKEDIYKEMTRRKHYVPAMRVMEQKPPSGGHSTNAERLLKRFKGSQRDGISPLEMIAKFTYELNYMIANNEIVRAMDTIARATPEGGQFLERLPASRIEAIKFDTADVLRAAAKEIGMDDIDALWHMKALQEQFDGQDSETVLFRRGESQTSAGDTVIFLYEEGQRIPIKVADTDLGRAFYEAITGLGTDKIPYVINMMAYPSKWLRAGITALDPAYAVRNFGRDQIAASIFVPGFIPGFSGARRIPAAIRRLYKGQYDETSEQFESFGGITGSSLGADIYNTRVKRDISDLRDRGIKIRDLKGWYEWIGVAETATRQAVFEISKNRALADGMDEYSAIIEATAASNDLLDWTRHGSNMLWLLKLIPFLNSQLQGLDKARRQATGKNNSYRTVEHIVSPYLKATDGQPLSIAERKIYTESKHMWLVVGVVLPIIGAMIALRMKDDEEVKDVPEYFRNTHWVFRAGDHVWRYPKPFELAIFSNLIERGLEAQMRQEPYQMWRFLKGAGDLLTPTTTVPGINTLYEQWANKTRFAGAPIVDDHLQGLPAWDQYNARTSELSKWIGYGMGVSPARIDHILLSTGGGFAGLVMKGTNQALPPLHGARAETRWSDVFETMRMVVKPGQASEARREFIEEVTAKTGAYTRTATGYKEMMDSGAAERADVILKNATPDQKAYALLNYHGDDYERSQHPLNRAAEVIKIVREIYNSIDRDKLRDENDKPYSPTQKRVLMELTQQLTMREARNAMVAVGEKGYRGLNVMDTNGILRELEARVPEVYETLQQRMSSQRVLEFEEVRAGWPALKKELLSPGYAEDHPHVRKRR